MAEVARLLLRKSFLCYRFLERRLPQGLGLAQRLAALCCRQGYPGQGHFPWRPRTRGNGQPLAVRKPAAHTCAGLPPRKIPLTRRTLTSPVPAPVAAAVT
jgi:hypothetical protein